MIFKINSDTIVIYSKLLFTFAHDFKTHIIYTNNNDSIWNNLWFINNPFLYR